MFSVFGPRVWFRLVLVEYIGILCTNDILTTCYAIHVLYNEKYFSQIYDFLTKKLIICLLVRSLLCANFKSYMNAHQSLRILRN